MNRVPFALRSKFHVSEGREGVEETLRSYAIPGGARMRCGWTALGRSMREATASPD